jgi:hypothetical protein
VESILRIFRFSGKKPFKYTNIRAIEGVIVNGKIVK